MTHALSNPYEITAGGVTVKCSPYGVGAFIANRDVPEDGAFLTALRDEFEVETPKNLDGIIVRGPKQEESNMEDHPESVKRAMKTAEEHGTRKAVKEGVDFPEDKIGEVTVSKKDFSKTSLQRESTKSLAWPNE